MNATRVLVAGLLAGLVLNVGEAVLHGVLLADATAAAMTALGRPATGSNAGLGSLIGITFVQGVLGMGLVALLMLRGATRLVAAALAGLALWASSSVYSAVYLSAGLPNVMPADVVWYPVGWQLVEYPLAIFIGALAYKPTA